MKYKVTAKKLFGEKVVNDWFKDSLSHMAYFTDSLNDAKKKIEVRVKNGNFYSKDCLPQIILCNSGKEITYV